MDDDAQRYRDFMQRAALIFSERDYRLEGRELTRDGELIWFHHKGRVHLVYCLPLDHWVTSGQIEACLRAKRRYGAHSCSVFAPLRFSAGALKDAGEHGVELRRV